MYAIYFFSLFTQYFIIEEDNIQHALCKHPRASDDYCDALKGLNLDTPILLQRKLIKFCEEMSEAGKHK